MTENGFCGEAMLTRGAEYGMEQFLPMRFLMEQISPPMGAGKTSMRLPLDGLSWRAQGKNGLSS